MRIPSQEGVPMTTYSLTKQATEWKGQGTHATAVITALKALDGKATGAEIADHVEERKLLSSTKMDRGRPAPGCCETWCGWECRRARESK
jgi:hypothetical protein